MFLSVCSNGKEYGGNELYKKSKDLKHLEKENDEVDVKDEVCLFVWNILSMKVCVKSLLLENNSYILYSLILI